MLNALRKGVGSWVAKIFLGVLILSFGVWGIGDIFRGGKQAVLATIGGTKITNSELNAAYRREVQIISSQIGRAIDPQMAQQLGVGQRAFQRLLSQTLLAEAAGDYGLAISDAVLRSAVVSDPTFQTNDGQFDRTIFQQVLFNAGLDEGTYLADLRGDLTREQLVSSLVAGSNVPAALAEPIYRFREESRVGEYFVITNDFFRTIGPADDAALEEYHRTNSQRYTAPELRSVTYVHITPEDLVSEIEISEGELAAEYEARLGEFTVAEKRTVDQLLYAEGEDARLARERLVAGEDIAVVAASTGALNADAISLGVLTRDSLPEELAERIFTLAPQEIGLPFQSLLGWHLFRVTNSVPAQARSLEDMREDLTRDLALRAATDGLFGLSNSIEDELAGGATLEEAASRLALNVHRIEALDRNGSDGTGLPVADLPAGQDFVDFVFRSDIGFESSPQETKDAGYFVVRVESSNPPSVRPLEDVREQVMADWRKEQQATEARNAANEALESLRTGRSFDSLASDFSSALTKTEPLPRVGGERTGIPGAVTGALFTLQLGGYTTAPLADGSGYVVARLDEIVGAEPGGDSGRLDQLRANLANALAVDLMSQYQRAVSDRLGVDINQGLADAVLLGGTGGGGAAPPRRPRGM